MTFCPMGKHYTGGSTVVQWAMPRSLTVNGNETGFYPDPRHRHLGLANTHLRGGDLLVFTDDDGARRHYRVNDFQRLPPGVHLEPHITLFRVEPAPPPPKPVDEDEPVVGVSVWERLKKPLLA